MTRSLAITLNALGLYAIALILLVAFGAQLILHELPCPLCLLQRIQFAMLAVGPILNVRFGPRPSHYAVSLLTAAAGAAFASRQILLHVMPGDLGYGSALLGYHYYTMEHGRPHDRDIRSPQARGVTHQLTLRWRRPCRSALAIRRAPLPAPSAGSSRARN
jgi:disulfide bond formation protein DsbB